MSRKILNVVIVIILLLNQISAVFAAQASSLTTKVETHLLPEYDTADVLVINRLNFTNASDAPYQGEMRFSVPKGTTNNIVKENTGGDTHIQVKVDDKGEYAELVWQPTQPIQPKATYSVHLEYYYSPLPGTGSKSFGYKYIPSYPVDTLSLYIYQPLKATDMKVEPNAQLLGQDDKGFNVYGLEYSGLLPEAPVELKISYTKNDPQPSMQAAGNGGASSAAPSTGISIPSWPVLLAVAALGGLIIVFALRSSQRASQEDEEDDDFEEQEESVTPENRVRVAKEKQELEQRLKRGLITEEYYEELLAELEEKHK